MKNPFWTFYVLGMFVAAFWFSSELIHHREARETRIVTCETREQIYAIFQEDCIRRGDTWQEMPSSSDCPEVVEGICQEN